MPTSSDHRADVADTLGSAGARPVVVRGRGTKFDWGGPIPDDAVIVDTAGLDRVLEHAAGDLVVHVEPGVTLSSLAEVLAPAGQRLAIDEVVPGSTVGGVIATGLAGPLRATVGGVRDLVLGVSVTLADGSSAKSGGRVVKNVAGYDLAKIYTGSFGTLGIVTSAWLRLHPVPERQAWVNLGDDPVPPGLAPAAVEVHASADGVHRVALIEGTAAGVAARLLSAQLPEVERPSWWGHIPGYDNPDHTLVKLTTVRTAVPTLVDTARRLGATIAGSEAAGILWAGLDHDVAASLSSLRAACAPAGGFAIAVRTPPAIRAEIDAWGPVPALGLMRRVKDRFDPDRRLAPGRFVGGI